MRKLFLTPTACLIICVACAQHIDFPNGKTSPGQPVTFTYIPANNLAGETGITAVVYAFEGINKMKAHEVNLTASDGKLTGTIPTTADTKVLYVKFIAGDKSDFNDKKGYMTKLYSATTQPVKGAYAVLASVHQSYGRFMDMDLDSKKAYEYLDNEFKLYPESKDEYLNLHATLAKANQDEEAMADIKASLQKQVSEKKIPEDDLISIRTVQDRLGEKDAAEVTRQRILKEFPKGRVAIEEKINGFYKEKDLAAKEKLFRQIQPSLSDDQVNNLAYNLAVQYGLTDKTRFAQYVNMIKSKSMQANAYNSMAWRLSGESIEAEAKDLDAAAAWSDKSLELIKSAMNSDADKPDFITSTAWKRNLQGSYGMFSDTYALILYKQGKVAEALEYQELYNQYGYPDADAHERYIIYLEKVKGKDAALEHMGKLIVEGKSNKAIKEKFKSTLASYSPEESAARSLLLLELQAREKLKKEVEKLMIDKEAPAFTLKDLDGNEVSLESLKGKTVVLDFWATWCGPCIVSFPGMQMAVDKYKDDESVKFLFIDVWESGDKDKKLDHVSKFVQNKGYRFHVLMDFDDKVVSSFGVDGIPTKFVVGPDGRIKFMKVGGGAADKLIDELYIMIDLAKADYSKKLEVSAVTN